MIKGGLFGYSGSGKTTLFRKLTGKQEEIYDPFTPNPAIARYEDKRLGKIKEVLQPKKIIFPEFEFIDLKGFPEGEGFPSHFFKNLYDVDIIICVVKNFDDGVNPEEEAGSLIMELLFHDIDKLEKIKVMREKEGKKENLDVIKKAIDFLKNDKFLKDMEEIGKKQLSGIELLTTKEVIIYLNGKNKNVDLKYPVVSNKDNIYEKIIKQLSMITFYTIKGDIAQAWIIKQDIPAKQAAGKIHKDIEKGFIKAVVLHWKDFVEIGDWKKAKSMGVVKFLGPNSFISDGDIVEFYFSK